MIKWLSVTLAILKSGKASRGTPSSYNAPHPNYLTIPPDHPELVNSNCDLSKITGRIFGNNNSLQFSFFAPPGLFFFLLSTSHQFLSKRT